MKPILGEVFSQEVQVRLLGCRQHAFHQRGRVFDDVQGLRREARLEPSPHQGEISAASRNSEASRNKLETHINREADTRSSCIPDSFAT